MRLNQNSRNSWKKNGFLIVSKMLILTRKADFFQEASFSHVRLFHARLTPTLFVTLKRGNIFPLRSNLHNVQITPTVSYVQEPQSIILVQRITDKFAAITHKMHAIKSDMWYNFRFQLETFVKLTSFSNIVWAIANGPLGTLASEMQGNLL